MGVHLDSAANARCEPDQDITNPDSTVRVLVVRTQEDWQIARECVRVLQS
jgi:acetate kinase